MKNYCVKRSIFSAEVDSAFDQFTLLFRNIADHHSTNSEVCYITSTRTISQLQTPHFSSFFGRLVSPLVSPFLFLFVVF